MNAGSNSGPRVVTPSKRSVLRSSRGAARSPRLQEESPRRRLLVIVTVEGDQQAGDAVANPDPCPDQKRQTLPVTPRNGPRSILDRFVQASAEFPGKFRIVDEDVCF